jgi:iron(III) transport system permease protein
MPACMLGVVAIASLVVLAHLAVVVWLSGIDGSPGAVDLRYTTQNYIDVFADARTYGVLIDTIAFASVSLIVALGFGIPVAWLAERTDLPAKRLIFPIMAIGLVIPGFAAAMGWLFLLHPRIGLVNQLLVGALHLAAPPFNITTVAGMGWVQGLNLAPLAFVMTAPVFRSMDPALEEAAQVHGARRAMVFGRVTARLAWPGILAATIYIFMTAFAAFDVPAIIGWGNRIFTFTTYLYLLLNPQDVLPRYGAGAALSTVAMTLAAAMSWWYATMQRRSRRFAVVAGRAYRPKLVRLRRGRAAAWCFIGSYAALSMLLPIALLAWSSLLPFFQLPSARALAAVSFAHYASLPWPLVLSGTWNSSVLAVLTPSLTLVVSLAFSWTVLRSKIPGRAVFDFIAFLPHAIPSIVFGVGALLLALFVIERALPIYGTLWILLIVFTIARLSYGTRMINSGMIQLHPELVESALTSGGTPWDALHRVVVPLIAPTLLYAWLWIALLTLRELTMAVILSSADNVTVAVVIWSLWLGGGLGQASALAVVMLLVMAPMIAIYWAFARRSALSST